MIGVLVFIIGACLGSFYLVIGKRLPVNKNVLTDRSRCDHCDHLLSLWELIPVVSYIILLGKCHYCHKRISILNLIIELVTGTLFLITYNYYGISYEMFMIDIIFSLLIIIFVSDFSYFIISDSPLIASIILILILDLIYLDIKQVGIYLLSGFALFVIMLLIKLMGDKIFKRESLGGGDIKFSFIIGLVLGFRLGLCSLILSTFLALPYSFAYLMLKKNNEVPYGPFLVASLFIVFAFLGKFSSLLDFIFLSI